MEFDFFGHEKSWNLNFQKSMNPVNVDERKFLHRQYSDLKPLYVFVVYIFSVVNMFIVMVEVYYASMPILLL